MRILCVLLFLFAASAHTRADSQAVIEFLKKTATIETAGDHYLKLGNNRFVQYLHPTLVYHIVDGRRV